MNRFPVFGLLIAAIVFAVDQATKYAVTVPLGLDYPGAVRNILPIFDLRFVPNEGVSLGLLRAGSDGSRWALVALTGAIALGVLVWMTRERNRQDLIALGMVLGGAIGNIVDRARFGYVVDFADLHFGDFRPFLVFNVADTAITVGVLVLLVRALLVRNRPGGTRVSVENSNA